MRVGVNVITKGEKQQLLERESGKVLGIIGVVEYVVKRKGSKEGQEVE